MHFLVSAFAQKLQNINFNYTGMDKTCLDTRPAPGSLFVSPDVGMSTHVERNNYVPLFGVDPIECRITLLRNT